MAVFLVLPDLRRLANLLVLNRSTEPARIRPLFTKAWLHRGALVFRTVLVLYIAGFALFISYRSLLTPKSPFYGIWNVEELEVDGQARPPLISDTGRWRRVVFDYPYMLAVYLMDQHRVRYGLHLNPQKRLLELSKRDDPQWKSTLSYEQLGPGRLALAGTIDGRKIRARLRLEPEPDFLLVNRGFHWISEYPFNR
jgi:hypothetical protein